MNVSFHNFDNTDRISVDRPNVLLVLANCLYPIDFWSKILLDINFKLSALF